ncbi:hypothetical protein AVEN_192308-1 [Araneus ventricosus]|uniref:Uncharacterized protein n=1 Tax=Araneus ventricosus TaxID=182803 RepID=A0A4Y2JP09_ARAVE|nr:hypothetical protein AVEN_192308-1 [Araneus ventricosus]
MSDNCVNRYLTIRQPPGISSTTLGDCSSAPLLFFVKPLLTVRQPRFAVVICVMHFCCSSTTSLLTLRQPLKRYCSSPLVTVRLRWYCSSTTFEAFYSSTAGIRQAPLYLTVRRAAEGIVRQNHFSIASRHERLFVNRW